MPTPKNRGQITLFRGRSVLGNGEPPVMSRPRKYPEELIDRGIRMVFESGRPIAHVAADLGIPSETLRKKVRQAEIDEGRRQGLSTASATRSRSCAARTRSCGGRTRFCGPPACFLRANSTQTDRSEPVYRWASGSFWGRGDLPDPGRVGVRLLSARDRRALGEGCGGRAAAGGDPEGAQGQLFRLWVTGGCGRRCTVPVSGSRAAGCSG